MRVAITGGTGFLGRYIVRHLAEAGDRCRCWFRDGSDRRGFEEVENRIEWVPGDLSDERSMYELVRGCHAVVHAALFHPGGGFRGGEGDLPLFFERNVLGSIRLIEAARKADLPRFVFISTCAVHEIILPDRQLDETHPLWPTSHYGAHKAAIEMFVHSYGLGHRYDICALRPTGIYGLARPASASKWHRLIHAVARGEDVHSDRGGKEVHAADVAKAVGILLRADGVAGQAYNCYDMYITDRDVAQITKKLTGSKSMIESINQGPKHQIDTSKLRSLGMTFGGRPLLEQTVRELLEQRH